jgi:AcrR family transcriptional regulator
MSEAGVSKSRLYHYFKDKEATIDAVVRHQTAEVIETHLPYLTRIDSRQYEYAEVGRATRQK